MGLHERFPGKPTRDVCAKEVMRRLQAAHRGLGVRFDRQDLSQVVFEGGEQGGVAYLGNGVVRSRMAYTGEQAKAGVWMEFGR
jgi:hypothetical protein